MHGYRYHSCCLATVTKHTWLALQCLLYTPPTLYVRYMAMTWLLCVLHYCYAYMALATLYCYQMYYIAAMQIWLQLLGMMRGYDMYCITAIYAPRRSCIAAMALADSIVISWLTPGCDSPLSEGYQAEGSTPPRGRSQSLTLARGALLAPPARVRSA